ncbi:MAG: glycyl-radical enzyme activating protein [Candidatus Aminicenantes bacterium]|nr:glycyl-radical enzyme activating protein [Candidatus Aminicenantes bacterium]
MQNSHKAIVFDIKHYAIHDGPGIRTTVFFKGCPLNCVWCHNPEGIKPEPEIFLRSHLCAEGCTTCLAVCPQKALSKPDNSSVVIDRMKCDLCGSCESACSYGALEVVGKEMTVAEIMKEVEKDRIFFEESGGGVTLSGGEPLSNPAFLEPFLMQLKRKNIHVVADTSGFFNYEKSLSILENIDLFLFDLKIMDPLKHKEYTGQSNDLILENLKRISRSGKPVAARIPLIADINDSEKNIKETCEYLRKLDNIIRIHLLPYHRGGEAKHKRLGKAELLSGFKSPSEEKINAIKKIISEYGFSVRIGG